LIASWILASVGFLAMPVAALAPRGLVPLLGVAAAVGLVALWREGGWHRLASPLTAVLALGGVWMLASAAWAISAGDALSTARGVLLLLLAAVVLLAIEAKDQRLVVQATALGFVIGIAILLPMLVAQGTAGHNRAASLLAILLAPLAWAVRAWLGRLLGVVLLVIGLATIGLAEGSSVKLAAVAAVVAGLAALLHRHIVLAIGAVATVVVVAMPLLVGLLPAPEQFGGLKYSAVHRAYIWRFTTERINEHPWRGWGLDAARNLPGGQTPLPGIDVSKVEGPINAVMLPLHPHNGALQVRVELGLPGALLLAAVVAFAYWQVSRIDANGARAAATAAVTAALGVGCLSFGLWQNWWIALLGIAAALGPRLVRA
jgi:O-antigen ligase